MQTTWLPSSWLQAIRVEPTEFSSKNDLYFVLANSLFPIWRKGLGSDPQGGKVRNQERKDEEGVKLEKTKIKRKRKKI